MTCLKYFIPLIAEGNARGIRSKVYWTPSRKYNCPSIHIESFNKLAKEFNFEIFKAESFPTNSQDLCFFVEGRGAELAPKATKAALTSTVDFRGEGGLYDKHIDKLDYYIFPNKSWVTLMPENIGSPATSPPGVPNKPKRFNEKKNLFLGSPKYDLNLNKNEILKKYNLSNKKKCFMFYPRSRDLHKIDVNKALEPLKKLGYEILVKYRAKENCPLKGSDNIKILKDESWHPHTSLELIYASSLVINTDSTGIKECVLLKKPVLNFKIKPFENWLNFLYNEKFHIELTMPIDYNLIEKSVQKLVNVKTEDFQETVDRFLFQPNSSKRILDFFKIT
jgi:hypothetical protein